MILAESYKDLMLDPNHALFELTWEVLSTVLVLLLLRPVARRLAAAFHRDMDRSHGIQHVTVEHLVPTDHVLTPAEAEAAAIHLLPTDEWVDA